MKDLSKLSITLKKMEFKFSAEFTGNGHLKEVENLDLSVEVISRAREREGMLCYPIKDL